jgi:hypothetical protein
VFDNAFQPAADSDVDLGATGEYWKDAFIDTITTTGAVTVGGNLTVNGTTTTVATTNTEVKDAFILLASGSEASNVDGGIIVQSGSFRGSGSALYHDQSTERWAVAKGVSKTATAAQTHEAFVGTVNTSAGAPNTLSGSYGVGADVFTVPTKAS